MIDEKTQQRISDAAENCELLRARLAKGAKLWRNISSYPDTGAGTG